MVLLVSDDEGLAAAIRRAGSELGLSTSTLSKPSQLGPLPIEDGQDGPLTEPLGGLDGAFVGYVAALQPALIVVDLAGQGLPGLRWIQRLATSAATRRIPRLAIVPDEDPELAAEAERRGADHVVAHGRLLQQPGPILAQLVRFRPQAAWQAGCRRELSQVAEDGLERLAAGAYFEAHEVLEQAWLQAPEEIKPLYRALVQTSVIYLHLERGNWRGAAKLLLRLHTWLDPLPDPCGGLDTETWRRQMEAVRAAVQAGPPLDPALLKPIPRARPG